MPVNHWAHSMLSLLQKINKNGATESNAMNGDLLICTEINCIKLTMNFMLENVTTKQCVTANKMKQHSAVHLLKCLY